MRESRRHSTTPSVGHLARRPQFFHQAPRSEEARQSERDRRSRTNLSRRLRVARRGTMIVLWTLPSMLAQAICLLLPGRPKVAFARLYWAVFTRLLGLRVRVVGQLADHNGGRPVIYVSNHSSWVDIPVVGGVLDGCFVAKGDVAGWPVIGTIARLGRTVFVSRQRVTTGR